MSLRARLIGGLLAVAAAGLLALAGITYAEQRSFLLERADQHQADCGQRHQQRQQPGAQGHQRRGARRA